MAGGGHLFGPVLMKECQITHLCLLALLLAPATVWAQPYSASRNPTEAPIHRPIRPDGTHGLPYGDPLGVDGWKTASEVRGQIALAGGNIKTVEPASLTSTQTADCWVGGVGLNGRVYALARDVVSG